MTNPNAGGSYIREKDGTLRRVEGTEPAAGPAAPAPAREPDPTQEPPRGGRRGKES